MKNLCILGLMFLIGCGITHNLEQEHTELLNLNSQQNKFVKLPETCLELLKSFDAQKNVFLNKSLDKYSIEDLNKIKKGCVICQFKFSALDNAINDKNYYIERDNNIWVKKAKQSVPDADELIVFATISIPNYPVDRFGGTLSDLVYGATARTMDNIISVKINKHKLTIDTIDAEYSIFFEERVKGILRISGMYSIPTGYVNDSLAIGILMNEIFPIPAKNKFNAAYKKAMEKGRLKQLRDTSDDKYDIKPRVIEL